MHLERYLSMKDDKKTKQLFQNVDRALTCVDQQHRKIKDGDAYITAIGITSCERWLNSLDALFKGPLIIYWHR
jgi:hypothetical protein